MVRAGAGAGIFNKLEPEPHKNGPAPQRWPSYVISCENYAKEIANFSPKSVRWC
jgi:hypothetical protein